MVEVTIDFERPLLDELEMWEERVGVSRVQLVQAALAGKVDEIEKVSSGWPDFVWRLYGNDTGWLRISISHALYERYKNIGTGSLTSSGNAVIKFVLSRLDARVRDIWLHEFAGEVQENENLLLLDVPEDLEPEPILDKWTTDALGQFNPSEELAEIDGR